MAKFKIGDILIGVNCPTNYDITLNGSINRVMKHWNIDIQVMGDISVQLLYPNNPDLTYANYRVRSKYFRKLTEEELVLWQLKLPNLK